MTGQPTPDHRAVQPVPHPIPVPFAGGSNGLGVAGFVCGLIGLIFCWVPFFGLVLGILGVVLGGVGMNAARRTGASSGLAIAGLVCGIVAVIPSLALTVVLA